MNGPNPCGTVAPLVCISEPGLLAAQYDRRIPYVFQYEFNIQHQLSNSTVAEIGYFGSQSHFLQRFHNQNNPIPGTGPTAPRRPFPEVNAIQYVASNVNANYHSLTGKITRRLTNGLSYMAGYTYSKAIDAGSGIRAFSQDNGIQNPACVRCERGLAVFDQRQRLVTSVLYDLPAGKGYRLFNSGIGSYVLGGWQMSTIVSISTGTPVGVGSGSNRSGVGLNNDRPNATGQAVTLPSDQRGPNQWFDIGAFSLNPTATFGNVGRNVITGPGVFNWDYSLLKRFAFTESRYLQLRFEAFNAANHPNWGDPGASMALNQINAATQRAIPGTGNFGVINSTRTGMRQIQIAMKIVF